MRQVLVTGAAGFLGVHLIAELRSRGMTVVAVDDGSAGTWGRLEVFAGDDGVRAQRAEICDRQALAAAWPEEIWGVAHLAARHFIPDCQANPGATWRTNVVGTANVLAIAAQKPPARFLLASTADVYAAGEAPHREADEVAPESVYGRTKQLGEAMVSHAASLGDETTFLVVRPFNLYGPQPTVDHLIPTLTHQAAVGDRLALGTLDSVRDYVFVADAAAAFAELLQSKATGVVNIGTGQGADGHTIVAKISQLLGRRLSIDYDPTRVRACDRPRLVADTARLRSLLPWWPATTLDQGLTTTMRAALR